LIHFCPLSGFPYTCSCFCYRRYTYLRSVYAASFNCGIILSLYTSVYNKCITSRPGKKIFPADAHSFLFNVLIYPLTRIKTVSFRYVMLTCPGSVAMVCRNIFMYDKKPRNIRGFYCLCKHQPLFIFFFKFSHCHFRPAVLAHIFAVITVDGRYVPLKVSVVITVDLTYIQCIIITF
jgi:hypothetical protein